ncbi:MAG TPA: copper chaperone PCu(A)C [Stellaceae bacterium]|nr:copper chaperone PCu(A)C [Stellaceae bacterium]
MPNARKAGLAASAAIIAISVLCAAPGAFARAPDGLALTGQWFRFIMASLPAAGYFTLANAGAAPQTLVGASSPACGTLMLHKSVTQNGTERMVMVRQVAVPAHGALRFAPGGYHLMCMSPARAMRPGNMVPVILRFAGGATMTANFPVRNATGK